MSKVDNEVAELIRDAAMAAAEAGYRAVYDDVRRNGPIRRALRGAGIAAEDAERVREQISEQLSKSGFVEGPRVNNDEILEKIASKVSDTDLARQVLVNPLRFSPVIKVVDDDLVRFVAAFLNEKSAARSRHQAEPRLEKLATDETASCACASTAERIKSLELKAIYLQSEIESRIANDLILKAEIQRLKENQNK